MMSSRRSSDDPIFAAIERHRAVRRPMGSSRSSRLRTTFVQSRGGRVGSVPGRECKYRAGRARDLVHDRDHRIPCRAAARPGRRSVVMSRSRIPAVAVERYGQRASAPYALYQLAGSPPAVIIPMGRVGHGFRDSRRRFDDLCRPGCACERGQVGGQQCC